MKKALAILLVSTIVLGLLASGISCTKTVYITVTPTPTTTQSPTPTIVPTPTATPELTPTPTLIPAATPTPRPSSTPKPTQAPVPAVPASEIEDYLTANYATLNTSLGITKFTFEVSKNTDIDWPYDYWIEVDYDWMFFDDLVSSINISTEMNHVAVAELRAHQEKLAKDIIARVPNAKFRGGYFKSGYRYPSIYEGYWSYKYFSWLNYSPSDYPTKYYDATVTTFTWNEEYDDTLTR
jgi:hypothetical protein